MESNALHYFALLSRYFLKGSYDAISSLPFFWSVTSWLCIDEIPEVATTKVSKPKRYSLSKLRLCQNGSFKRPLKRLIQTRPHMSTSRCGNICVMPPKCSAKKEGVVSVTTVVLMQSCQGEAVCFYVKAKALYLAFWKEMHLGIIKTTEQHNPDVITIHFMDEHFVNLGEDVILTLLWQTGASESATVCMFSLSICYWLLKCGVLRVVFSVCACALCERERERDGYLQTHTSIITVCHATLFLSRAWTDGKTNSIINCLYFNFESWSSRLWKGALHFRWVLAVFGQSQCTGSAGQSEQTVLIGRRDFVEKRLREAGHRGPTIMYSIWKIMCFLTLKHVNIFCYTKYTK